MFPLITLYLLATILKSDFHPLKEQTPKITPDSSIVTLE